MDANKKKKHRHIFFYFWNAYWLLEPQLKTQANQRQKYTIFNRKIQTTFIYIKPPKETPWETRLSTIKSLLRLRYRHRHEACEPDKTCTKPNNSASLSGIREEGPTCRATRAPRNISLYTQNSKPKRQKLPNPPSDSVGFPSNNLISKYLAPKL